MKKVLLTLLLSLSLLPITHSQEPTAVYPSDYFDPPMKNKVSLAASFAEIRPNHFHSGIDLRIGGKVGEPVYAPADGYVSRISISAWGGGKVLYITHPNGFRTVFMHLNDFVGTAGRIVKEYQYEHHTYTLDLTLSPETIPVSRGQLIAHAGNTGSSGGPHLHYEIRYADNDQPINPLYFGFDYSDPVKPLIRNIKVYPADTQSQVNHKYQPHALRASAQGAWTDSVTVCGSFYVGIYTTDVSEYGTTGKNGVERIALYVDDSLFHCYATPTFLFSQTRAVNAIIDYPQYLRNGEYYILTRCLRGNNNRFSAAANGSGLLRFNDGRRHRLRYVVTDYKGNTTTHTFYVRDQRCNGEPAAALTAIDRTGDAIAYNHDKQVLHDDFEAMIPAGTLYADDYLLYAANSTSGLSDRHSLTLQLNPIPPHTPFRVRLRVHTTTVPTDKLVITCTNGKKKHYLTTHYDDDRWLSASCLYFGTFAAEADTTPPRITPLNFSNARTLASRLLKVKITDSQSGISTYHAYLNGDWVLAEYDGKTASLSIDATKELRQGRNTLRLVITDAVGNEAETIYHLMR